MRKNISSGSPYEGPIGFSRAVRIGNRVCVSGTAPIAKDGSVESPGNVYLQTKRCLEIIKHAIEEAGGSLSDVIRTRVYLTDARTWNEAAKAHGEYFSQIKPACTFVEVSRLIDPQWLVEIEAECEIDTKQISS
jgi:enamine deaminase RidA (YjgF/YER057c/UK114 family)